MSWRRGFVLLLILGTLAVGTVGDAGENISIQRTVDTANAYLDRVDYYSALETAEKGLAANPFYIPLWLVKAKAYLATGQYDQADEAIRVCLTAEPANPETLFLAFRIYLEAPAQEGNDRVQSLSEAISEAGPQTFRRVLEETILTRRDFALNLPTIIAAWERSGIGPQEAIDVLTLYDKQEFAAAAERLARPSASEALGDLEGMLNFVVGRGAVFADQRANPLPLLEKARALGFSPLQTTFLIRMVLRDRNDPLAAAEALAADWRQTGNPVRTVSELADDFIKGGKPEDALELLDDALATFRNMPSLQAKRLLVLYVLGRHAEAKQYESELRTSGAMAGLGYGRALIARHDGDPEKAAAELAAVRDYAAKSLGRSLNLESTESWLEFGHQVTTQARVDSNHALASLARRLWDEGKRADAIALWDENIAAGMNRSNSSLVETASLLAAENMGAQAVALLNRRLPEMSALDLVVQLANRSRWESVENIFRAVDVQASSNTSWPALYRALSAMNGAVPENASRAVRELLSFPGETKTLAVHFVAPDDSLLVRVLPLSEHQRLLAELESMIVLGGYEELYPDVFASALWQGGTKAGNASLGNFGALLIRSGQTGTARRAFTKIKETAPGDPTANYYLAVLEERSGNYRSAAAYAADGLAEAEGLDRERLLAVRARLAGDSGKAADHLLEALRLAPDDHDLRREAIHFLVVSYRFNEAIELNRHFESLHARGDADIASYLAMSYVELGEYEKAAVLWRTLTRRFPRSLQPLLGLAATLNLMEQPAETIKALTLRAEKEKDPELLSLLAEAHMALGEAEEALKWAEAGLADHEKDLRLLRLAAGAAEALQNHSLIEQYAKRYIEIDPESASMQGMYGQALMDQEKWSEVYCHNVEILDKNCRNWAALERESERVKACDTRNAYKMAWAVDKLIADNFANDPSLVIRAAVTGAGAGKFRYALPKLENYFNFGPNSSTVTLYYSQVSLGKAINATSLEALKNQFNRLVANQDHVVTGIGALAQGPSPERNYICPVPLVLVIGRSRPDALAELDAYLASVGGKAALVIGEESLSEKTPVWSDVNALRKLAATGRWQFLLTDTSPVRLPGKNDGEWTNYWTEAKWLGGRFENDEEMRARLASELARRRNLAEAAGIQICGWVHPSWGDYGHRLVTARQNEVLAYRRAVADVFPLALTQTPSGYRVPDTDRMRVPMRAVSEGLDANELAISLGFTHPTRRAVLELAKVKSWHAQFPTANKLFCASRRYDLDAKEIAYFQGRNSFYEGDVPSGADLAHETMNRDPERERSLDLFQDTHRLFRPLLALEPRYWYDSNDEKYRELVATLTFHVSKKLEIRLTGGGHQWESPEGRKLDGASLGGGFRYYFKPENYFQAELKGVTVNKGGGDYLEAHAVWHGGFDFDFLKANGTFDLEYHREGIETAAAQEKKVRANRFAINTATRLCNFWDLDFNAYYINRTDGNDTVGMMFRPTYRISEMPQFRFGYWFAAADSDRNPPEYYAPVEYMAHQAVAMYRHNIHPKFTLTGLASYGLAKTRTTDWREVLRLNGGFTWNPTDCISISGGYQYLKLPDYWLRQATLSVAIRF